MQVGFLPAIEFDEQRPEDYPHFVSKPLSAKSGIANQGPWALLKALQDEVRREFEQKYPESKGKFDPKQIKEFRAEIKRRYDAVATNQSLW